MKLFRKDLPSFGPELVDALGKKGYISTDIFQRDTFIHKLSSNHPPANAIIENSLIQDWQATTGRGRIFVIPKGTSEKALQTDLTGVTGRDIKSLLPGAIGFWFEDPHLGQYFSIIRLQESSILKCKVASANDGEIRTIRSDHLSRENMVGEYEEWAFQKMLVFVSFSKSKDKKTFHGFSEHITSFCAPIWDDESIDLTEQFIGKRLKGAGAKVTCADSGTGRNLETYEEYYAPEDQEGWKSLFRLHVNLLLIGGAYPKYIKKSTVKKRVRGGKYGQKKKTVSHPVFELRTNVLDHDKAITVCSGINQRRRTHWRRGHWRRQPHSSTWVLTNQDAKTIQLLDGREAHMVWIEPMLVGQ